MYPDPDEGRDFDRAKNAVLDCAVFARPAPTVPLHSCANVRVCRHIHASVPLYRHTRRLCAATLAQCASTHDSIVPLYTGTLKNSILRVCHCRGIQMSVSIKIFREKVS